ncbi:MAG TPA: PKD domain-containing protein [Thermoanaerobaculia bacterium]|nr:PKD domain-containing protein [Thermoanaerobaculia bacterium]
MKTKLYLSVLSLALAAAGLAACDKASPVAPAGTVLSVTANPTQIAANGVSQIRVVALRANGTPVNPGTQIRLSTNLGTVDPLVEVGEGGIAVGTLQGDGRIGTAEVTATVGADTSATVQVQVGQPAANLSLQATPSSIPETGASVQLLALVRDASGQPLPDANVNFSAEIGDLTSGGGFIRTDSSGQARDTLRVSEADIATLADDNFQVSASVQTGDALTTETFDVSLQRRPDANFNANQNGLQVAFEDISTNNPTSWFWEFGDGDTSTAQNPTHLYSLPAGQTSATFFVTLTARNAIGESSITKPVTVRAD